MDEKVLNVVSEALNTSKEAAIMARDLAQSKDDQNVLFCKTLIKMALIFAVVIIIVSGIAWSLCFYQIQQSYDYEGYPEHEIQNTNIGGDYNAETAKTKKTAETNKTNK